MRLRRKATPATGATGTTADDQKVVSEPPTAADFVDDQVPAEHSGPIAELIRRDDGIAARTLPDQTAAVSELAAELGVTASDVAHPIAQAEERWRSYISAHGLAERRDPDRFIEARIALEALELRKRKLEARLRVETLPRKQSQLREALNEVDAAEDRHWPILHPPAVNGEPGRDYFDCPKCGAALTRRQNYFAGCCSICQRTAELVSGRSFPEIQPN